MATSNDLTEQIADDLMRLWLWDGVKFTAGSPRRAANAVVGRVEQRVRLAETALQEARAERDAACEALEAQRNWWRVVDGVHEQQCSYEELDEVDATAVDRAAARARAALQQESCNR